MTDYSDTQQIMRWFAYGHLPEGPLREASLNVAVTAGLTVGELPDGPELTAGLRHLLEAKDCFVRAAIAAQEGR